MDRLEGNVTPARVAEFVAKYGRAANHTLSYLGKHQGFVTAITSEIGAKLLEDDVLRWQDLFDKVARLEAKEDEKAEFRYLSRRIEMVSHRISNWLTNEAKITKS